MAGGIPTICAGVAFVVLNDALAKVLTERYDPMQIILLRNVIALPMIASAILLVRGRSALRSNHVQLHAFRALVIMLAAYLLFSGLVFLPLPEAIGLVFAAPIFVTALSVPLLGESVGWQRWGAVILGFVGVLILVRPGGARFQVASLMPVGTAFLYALFMISARWIGWNESLWTMMFFVVLFPTVYAAPFVLWAWSPVQAGDLPLFFGMAIFGSLGITLIGQAFRMAPATVVAPFDYTALVWATVLGFLIWGDITTLWTIVRALVIVASGTIVVLREADQRQQRCEAVCEERTP